MFTITAIAILIIMSLVLVAILEGKARDAIRVEKQEQEALERMLEMGEYR